jgi:tRNA pseudouridine38-40 synthase
MKINRYKIIVAYDGTDFHGWQIQPSAVTVASTLEKKFLNTFCKKIHILGASRTDAGVHALGQVALCKTELDLDVNQICKAWNNSLPNSILIRSIEPAGSDFKIFGHVKSKTYYYHLFYRQPLPFVARFGWFWKFIDQVAFSKFEKAMNCFVGEHDFRSFCRNAMPCDNGDEKSTIKKIDSISITKLRRFSVIRVEIRAKGFLRYQIRRMVGAALDVARKKNFCADLISNKLKNPSDQQEFTRAQSCGLCLRKILY